VDSTKPQATASFGRVVLADFSIVFLKALAGGVAASIVAGGIVLAQQRTASSASRSGVAPGATRDRRPTATARFRAWPPPSRRDARKGIGPQSPGPRRLRVAAPCSALDVSQASLYAITAPFQIAFGMSVSVSDGRRFAGGC